MGTYRIALANLEISASREASLHHALQAIELAGRKHADIICFPECFVPGYRKASRLMSPPDVAFLERAWTKVAETAAQTDIAVILGTERIVDSGLRATALVVNRDGTIAGFQDKVQIAIEEESIYTPGTERHLFRSGQLRFGVVICHEGWRYPETVRWAARRGAQIVFHPHFHQRNPTSLECSASDDPARKVFENAMVCRAAENTCYFASVNCASAGGTTTSTVIAPDGAVLASHPEGKAGLIVIEVDLDASTGFLARRCKY